MIYSLVFTAWTTKIFQNKNLNSNCFEIFWPCKKNHGSESNFSRPTSQREIQYYSIHKLSTKLQWHEHLEFACKRGSSSAQRLLKIKLYLLSSNQCFLIFLESTTKKMPSWILFWNSKLLKFRILSAKFLLCCSSTNPKLYTVVSWVDIFLLTLLP